MLSGVETYLAQALEKVDKFGQSNRQNLEGLKKPLSVSCLIRIEMVEKNVNICKDWQTSSFPFTNEPRGIDWTIS